MKYSDFEKHIGNELGKAQEAVNMNELLIGLNLANLAPKRKTRPFFLWIMIPLLLIGSIATFLVMEGTNVFKLNKVSANAIIQSKTDSKKVINEINAGMINVNQNANTELLNDKTKGDIEKTIQTTTINTKSKNSEVKSPDYILALRKNDLTNIQLNQETHLNSLPDIHSIESQKKLGPTTPIVNENIFSNSSMPGLTNLRASVSTELSKGDVVANGRSYYESMPNNNLNPISRAHLSLSSISMRPISVSGLGNERASIFSRMKINCPSFNQAYWRLALIPDVGIFAPFKTLENKKEENGQAFEERRKMEETLEGINLGLYSMLVRDGLPIYFKAGISYSRISERMDLEYNYTELDTTIGVISQTVSANGDSITTIMGPIVSEIEFTGKNRQHNYIHLFDLPVSVGYNAYVAGFDVGIEGGVKINLMTRATGNLLTSKSEFTNLSLNELYKKRIGLSYFGGLMVGRNFGRFGDIYIAPRFTYYPTDFSNDNNDISQKYVTMGVNVGYVYKLK